ncbi:MAG: DUF86 domain-containing protein [Actinobacteria bacterium]|nr:DUF86 domain-containing protein [Actinomycetota bacterium]MCG2799506.1 DUF86 domain-containing protein [Cellulomonas sp.]
MSRTDDQRLRDIVESIAAIDRADALLRAHPGGLDIEWVALDAIHYRVFTIGEAVKGLSSDLRDSHSEVPWSDIARMRDLIGHHYYKLDPQIVRATIGEPIAHLRTACEEILARRSESDDETDRLLRDPVDAGRLLASIERLKAYREPKPERSE